MLELKGSEKQIVWATTIRTTWINQLNDVINTAQIRVDTGTMPQAWVDATIEASKKPLSLIDEMDSASRFIDGRKINLGYILHDEAVKIYKKNN